MSFEKTILVGSLVILFGCEEEISTAVTTNPGARRAPPAAEKAEPRPTPRAEIKESDFVEAEGSRDPFRSYAKTFVEEARGQVKSQREVVLEQYAVDELTLIGIITGVKPERAMLVDPTGLGHVVVRGQFVGRASVVQPAGGVGAGYEVNWRVDRIRDGDLVLVRDDPSNPQVPSATRVIPLRTDHDAQEESPEASSNDVESQLRDLKNRINQIDLGAKKPADSASSTSRP